MRGLFALQKSLPVLALARRVAARAALAVALGLEPPLGGQHALLRAGNAEAEHVEPSLQPLHVALVVRQRRRRLANLSDPGLWGHQQVFVRGARREIQRVVGLPPERPATRRAGRSERVHSITPRSVLRTAVSAEPRHAARVPVRADGALEAVQRRRAEAAAVHQFAGRDRHRAARRLARRDGSRLQGVEPLCRDRVRARRKPTKKKKKSVGTWGTHDLHPYVRALCPDIILVNESGGLGLRARPTI
mmetsp:Transcript_26867/g.67650  ORF Transcript_26867/g.67650 Transcript_26867/m.67650 type:complete len:247 (-) Transcript_26867:2851-3591(-)